MDFTCPRCDFCSTRKQDLFRHVSRKVACTPSKGDIDLTDLKMQFQSSSKAKTIFECDNCSKKFKYTSGLSRHKKNCTMISKIDNNDDMDKNQIFQHILEELRLLRKQLPPQQHNINTTNNTDNSIHINITSFGNEDTKHIEAQKDFLTECFMDKDIASIIEKIHLDPDFPQNQNVRMKSLKHNLMEYKKQDKWVVGETEKIFDQLINKGYRILKLHTRKNKESILDECEEREIDIEELNTWLDFLPDDKEFKMPVHKELSILFINNSAIILDPSEFIAN